MIDAGSDGSRLFAVDHGVLCEAPGKPVVQSPAAEGIPGFGEARSWMNLQIGRDRDHDRALVELAALGLAIQTLTSLSPAVVILHSDSIPSTC